MGVREWLTGSRATTEIAYSPEFLAQNPPCFWHGPEDREGAYAICVECEHVFRKERHLRRAHRRVLRSISDRLWLKSFLAPTSEIWSCPLCTRDW